MKVIITYARGWNALSAARSLGSKGVEVVTGDEYRFAPASFSKYTVDSFLYPNPDRETEAFLDCLDEQIEKHMPEDGELVLMPFHKESYVIAEHRDRFEGRVKFALPKIEQIEDVHDKGALARFCEKENIPSPRTVVPTTREEFLEAAAKLSYPSFVKVRDSAAAVGIAKVDSEAEAIETWDQFVDEFKLDSASFPLIQEGVPGDDYCATFLFDHGEPRASMVYHNLRTYPVKSGTGVLRETVESKEMTRIGEDLLRRFNWHGVAEIDFRWDGESQPLLIEVNPRFWGGLPQAVESGWDYPWLLYRLAVDGTVESVTPGDSSVRTETPVMAMLATLHEVVHDEKRLEEMKAAFGKLGSEFVPGNRRSALKQFARDLKDASDLKGRWENMRALFRDHKDAVSDVFTSEDPLPALGVFYPLAVFLKHGKISTELLVSEGPRDETDEK